MKAKVSRRDDTLIESIACPSGNRCSVQMQVTKARKVSLVFSWDHTPGPDDIEEWSLNVLGIALEAARHEALKYHAAVEAIRQMEAKGLVERIGITEYGEWLFQRTGNSPDDRERGGIVSLSIARDGRRSRQCRR
jgi:hypothetical protein